MKYVDPSELYSAYRKHPNIQIDSRKVSGGDLFVGFVGTQVDGNNYAAKALAQGAAYVIVDNAEVCPAGDERYLLVEDSLAALQELAITHRKQQRMPTLAITGSNGKTTTKELINAVMSRQYRVHATPGNYNNHLGLPLTVLSTPEETEMLILEMGANHQGEIADLCVIGRPTHGLITNIGEAHLEGFGGIPGVIAGKGELFDYLGTQRGVCFVNEDEEYLSEMVDPNARVIYFRESDAPSKEVAAMEIKVLQLHPHIRVEFLSGHGETLTVDVELSGRHNLQNVKAAVAVGKYFKVPGREIATALAGYRSENHRSQWMEQGGVKFYWDAYNANPSSTMAALNGFGEEIEFSAATAVIGEMLELGSTSAEAHRRIAFRAGQVAGQVALVGEAMREPAREFERPWFQNSNDLATWFWKQDWSGQTVFVKGSRGNKLERLLEIAPKE
ncbi:UDP-N-acetylmuramoyl-tripeptide--D-alanyl-D-alanine ligase [Lewinella sp. 4G2]|uniref:UDP-N-acetylmuramoyl-tripeptide--D-alanyl-D- alanine ligase n=1 Tax=Lewinella sp. 4G2 TaxID=1803372 RepID=UPI0007B47CF7|nr:UDP-N-acetylmuramoyl-tripeptide--D-alanyl-D-alanine ligase [Lewinella sp. 4G2]OAV42901.1 hypothetical protein A3850_016895 [Lewinella sp. 4G2]